MCNCKLKFNNGSYTLSEIMANPELANAISNNNIISKECFANQHPNSWFRYVWCAAPNKLKTFLKPYGLDKEVNSTQDVMNLAKINENGIDVKQYGVNLFELAKKQIVLTSAEMGKADCLIFC